MAGVIAKLAELLEEFFESEPGNLHAAHTIRSPALLQDHLQEIPKRRNSALARPNTLLESSKRYTVLLGVWEVMNEVFGWVACNSGT